MRISNKTILIFNLLTAILFILPVFRLDYHSENYSTLSFDTRGYLYLLFLGLCSGSLLGYETYRINSKREGILMFITMMIGVIIPHHYPYDLQGNIHLILAYVSFAGLYLLTFSNIKNYPDKTLHNILFGMLGIVAVMYIYFGMVTSISELIIILCCLYINYRRYISIH